MIVWVNGSFGAGKTQATHELVRRTERSRPSKRSLHLPHAEDWARSHIEPS